MNVTVPPVDFNTFEYVVDGHIAQKSARGIAFGAVGRRGSDVSACRSAAEAADKLDYVEVGKFHILKGIEVQHAADNTLSERARNIAAYLVVIQVNIDLVIRIRGRIDIKRRVQFVVTVIYTAGLTGVAVFGGSDGNNGLRLTVTAL